MNTSEDQKITFCRNLIKGRIVETIFQQMFSATGKFTVIPMGYEHTLPELSQHIHDIRIKEVIDNIRNAPDFVLITENYKEVFLVETKFRCNPTHEEMVSIAQDLYQAWPLSHIFLATKENFYMDTTMNIINSNGSLKALIWDREEKQKYLGLLREFIQ